MKALKTITSCITVLLLGVSALVAQEAMPSAGGELSGSGGTVSYSIGQLFYLNAQDNDYLISEGIQQPFEIQIVSSFEYPETINLECKVYPNPVANRLVLKFENQNTFNLTKLNYKLYDTNGRQLINKNELEALNEIDMSQYSQGSYFLTVFFANQKLKLFKIIKN